MNKKVLIIIIVILAVLVVIFGGVEAYFTFKGRKNTSSATQDNKEAWTFTYNDMNMAIGEEFTRDKYGEELEYSEVASCAFDGLDKTYKYEHYEITTYPEDGKEKIFSIYFLDESIATKEGLSLGSSYDDMINLYGDDFEKNENLYTYTNGSTLLNCIVENDVVTSIEYALSVN